MCQEPKKENKSKRTIMLVERVKGSDVDAFVELVKIYKQEIFGYCYKRLEKYKQEAEIVAADVFIKAFDKIGKLRENGRFKSWLYSIAHNECIDKLKEKGKFIPDPVDDLDIRDMSPLPVDKVIADEKEKRIESWAKLAEDIINGLDSKYRDIFNLIHYQELKYKEAAEILHIPESTAKTRMRRSLSIIREKLKQYKDLYDELF